jgi:PKHD-type hydroxylase
MILEIDNVLDADELARVRALVARGPWADGRATAGYQSALAKKNEQLPEDCAETREAGAIVLGALSRSLLFQSAALPLEIFPPLFNRYAGGHSFGVHVDNAIRPARDGRRIRTDLSATLFLEAPESYDGGELVIEDGSASHAVKCAAGSMVLYPGTTLHEVRPVVRGVRVACFFWVQSLVAEQHKRSILFDMDLSIQKLRGEVGDGHAALVALTGAYHNLLRLWAAP